jgi:hypothetical protein
MSVDIRMVRTDGSDEPVPWEMDANGGAKEIRALVDLPRRYVRVGILGTWGYEAQPQWRPVNFPDWRAALTAPEFPNAEQWSAMLDALEADSALALELI